MLYEVITGIQGIVVFGAFLFVFKFLERRWTALLRTVYGVLVITSYSIHYTKLYDKEYIKTRRTLLWMLLVLIGATFALFLFVNHEIEVKQVSFFWFQQMVSNNLFFVWMLPVFPLMAAIFGVVQFLPETIGRRFRLSLFMPENELVISFSMLGFGLLALTLLFTLQFVVFAVLFSGIITLIWLLAAAKVFVCFWLFSFATYLLIVLIFIAQKTT